MLLAYPAPDTAVAHGPSPLKKIRPGSADSDGSRLALVSVTDAAPLLASGGVRCPIMLHYSSKESPGSPSGECAGFLSTGARLAGSERYFHGKVASTTVTGARTQHRWETAVWGAVYSNDAPIYRPIIAFGSLLKTESWLYPVKTVWSEVNEVTQSHF